MGWRLMGKSGSRVLRPLFPAAEELLTAACKKFTPYVCDILKKKTAGYSAQAGGQV